MKKQILSLGKVLNREEQKYIKGGGGICDLHNMSLEIWHSLLNTPGFVCPVDGDCVILQGTECVNKCLVEGPGTRV